MTTQATPADKLPTSDTPGGVRDDPDDADAHDDHAARRGKLSLSLLSLALPFPLDGLRKRFERTPELRAFLGRVDGGRPGQGLMFVYEADVPAIRAVLGLEGPA